MFQSTAHSFVVDESVRQDSCEEVVVSDAEIFKVGRLIDAPDKDGELTLENVRHEILLQVVHHEGHVVP